MYIMLPSHAEVAPGCLLGGGGGGAKCLATVVRMGAAGVIFTPISKGQHSAVEFISLLG